MVFTTTAQEMSSSEKDESIAGRFTDDVHSRYDSNVIIQTVEAEDFAVDYFRFGQGKDIS